MKKKEINTENKEYDEITGEDKPKNFNEKHYIIFKKKIFSFIKKST